MYVRCWNCSQDIECSHTQNDGVENVIPPIIKELYKAKRIHLIVGDTYMAKGIQAAIDIVEDYL